LNTGTTTESFVIVTSPLFSLKPTRSWPYWFSTTETDHNPLSTLLVHYAKWVLREEFRLNRINDHTALHRLRDGQAEEIAQGRCNVWEIMGREPPAYRNIITEQYQKTVGTGFGRCSPGAAAAQ
jgi:hypothetical protein